MPTRKVAITCSSGNDGTGAQFHRKLAAYAIARHLNIPHQFEPFRNIQQQGLGVLVSNKRDDDILNRANDRLALPTDLKEGDLVAGGQERRSVTTLDDILRLCKSEGPPLLLDCDKLPNRYICDRQPEIQQLCEGVVRTRVPKNAEFTVGIHVRRGELFVVDSWRMLPNEQYVAVAKKVIECARARGIEPRLELYTEVPPAATTITGDHPGILNRIKEPVRITPEACGIADFDCLPNLHKYINEDQFDTLDRMMNADILITSNSSFSACASHMKKWGVSIQNPTWYAYRPREIAVNAPDFTTRLNRVLDQYTLPRRFFQIWFADHKRGRLTLPPQVRESFLNANPGWLQKTQDVAAATRLIGSAFDDTVLAKQNSIRIIQHRSDFLRCILLYLFGGVQVDVDTKIDFALAPLLAKQSMCDFIGCIGIHAHAELAIALMISVAKNPFVREFIDIMMNSPVDAPYAQNIRGFQTYLKTCFGVSELEPFRIYRNRHWRVAHSAPYFSVR